MECQVYQVNMGNVIQGFHTGCLLVGGASRAWAEGGGCRREISFVPQTPLLRKRWSGNIMYNELFQQNSTIASVKVNILRN